MLQRCPPLGVRAGDAARSWCEPLESRVFMDGTPLPQLSALENINNPVYRIETSFGAIDIEMLMAAAPQTIGTFDLDFRASLIDQTVFHRSLSGQVLQMGAVQYRNAGTSDETLVGSGLMERGGVFVPPGAPPPRRAIVENPAVVLRDPLQWTVSYSEVIIGEPIAPGSSTMRVLTATALSFNLTDNPVDPLDTAQPGVIFTAKTVIGRVLPGTSRSVITAIAGLPTVDSSGYTIPDQPFGFLLGSFPTRALITTGTSTAPPAVQAVEAIDIEIIKELNVPEFFRERLYYPEGFAGPLIDERILLHNPGPATIDYQIIARYENGVRDQIISTRQLVPNFPSVVGLSELSSVGLARPYEPYALEIHATGPIAATLYHRDDFWAADPSEGVQTPPMGGEAFFSTGGYSDEDLTVWDFGHVTLQGETQFLLWQNLSTEPAHLRVTFYRPLFGAYEAEITVPPLRRGGWAGQGTFETSTVTNNQPLGARVVSDQPIVVALTAYTDGSVRDQSYTMLGIPAGGSTRGAAPGRLKTFFDASVPITNPGPAAANVTLWVQADADADPRSLVVQVPAAEMKVLLFSRDVFAVLYPGQQNEGRFAVWYESDVPVAMSYVTDGVGAAYAVRASSVVNFADGSLGNGADVDLDRGDAVTTKVIEEISIFNPSADHDITFSLTYRFLDRTTLTTSVISVGARRRVVVQTAEFADVFAKIRSMTMEHRYGITLDASGPVVAQLSGSGPTGAIELRFGEIGHMGNPFGTFFGLDDPMFD